MVRKNELREAILQYMDTHNLKLMGLAKASRVNYETIRKIIRENHIPKQHIIVRIIENLGLDPSIIAVGLRDGQQKEYVRERLLKDGVAVSVVKDVTSIMSKIGKTSWVDFVGWVPSSLGLGLIGDNYKYKEPKRQIATECLLEPKVALEIADDSMQPEFRPKDMIIISPQAEYGRGDLVVVKIKDNLYFRKYYLEEVDNKRAAIFLPANPKFEFFTDIKEFEILGRVCELKRGF